MVRDNNIQFAIIKCKAGMPPFFKKIKRETGNGNSRSLKNETGTGTGNGNKMNGKRPGKREKREIVKNHAFSLNFSKKF